MKSLAVCLSRAIPTLAVAAALAGCRSTAPPDTSGLAAYLQQVDDAGISPAAERQIRPMECVVWLNTSRDRPVTILLRKGCKTEVG